MRQRREIAIVVGAAAMLLAALPAHSDWLVLHDGSRVETDGEWSVKGQLLVFKTAAGRLASLRLAEVDLAASDQATAAAKAPPPAPAAAPKTPRKATVVLTDADISRAEFVPSADEGEATNGANDGGAAKPAEGGSTALEVGTWQQVDAPDGNGLQIYGTVTNKSAKMASDLALKILLYDAEGAEIASQDAAIGRGTLAPATSANFSANFAGIFSFSAVKFVPSARSFETRSLPSPAPSAGGGQPAEGTTPGGGEGG